MTWRVGRKEGRREWFRRAGGKRTSSLMSSTSSSGPVEFKRERKKEIEREKEK